MKCNYADDMMPIHVIIFFYPMHINPGVGGSISVDMQERLNYN